MQEFMSSLLVQQLEGLCGTLVTHKYSINVLQLFRLLCIICRQIKNYCCTWCCCWACRCFTRRSWNMKPLAIMYERPAKIWVYRYSREEPGRRSFRAMPSETIDVAVSDGEFCAREESFVHVPVAGMMTAAQDKDNSDCRFLMPATSTQSGPIVYASSNVSAHSKISSTDPRRRHTTQNTPTVAPHKMTKNTVSP